MHRIYVNGSVPTATYAVLTRVHALVDWCDREFLLGTVKIERRASQHCGAILRIDFSPVHASGKCGGGDSKCSDNQERQPAARRQLDAQGPGRVGIVELLAARRMKTIY